MQPVNHFKWFFAVNLALNKPAYQSSTSADSVASRSVDGNHNTDLIGGHSCSNTNDLAGGPNWWVVDLGQPYHLSHVILTNRAGGSGEY